MIGETYAAAFDTAGLWLFRLVTNPAYFVTCTLNRIAQALINAEDWLDQPTKLSNIKAQKISHFLCTATNWLLVKRLKLTITLIQFIWQHTFGGLGEAVAHFQEMATGKDSNGSTRSRMRKILYGIISAFLSTLSWFIILFPVFAYIIKVPMFITMIGWFKHLGQKIDRSIKSLIATQDTNDILATTNLYSLREIGSAIKDFAAGLWCMIFAAVISVTVVASRKLFGLCHHRPTAQKPEKPQDPPKKPNALIDHFLAECNHLKHNWDASVWQAILRLIINPAKMIGFIIGAVNYGLVTLSQSWDSTWYGKFLNCFIIDRLQILVQLIQYVWRFIGGELASTIDHCMDNAIDKHQSFWARFRSGLTAGLLGIFSWLLVIEPYIGALHFINKALPFMKWMNHFGTWLHSKMMEGKIISNMNNAMGWAGLYPFRLLGQIIRSISIFIWTFVISAFLFKANNSIQGIHKPGKKNTKPATTQHLVENILGVKPDAIKALCSPKAESPQKQAIKNAQVLGSPEEEKPRQEEASSGIGDWVLGAI